MEGIVQGRGSQQPWQVEAGSRKSVRTEWACRKCVALMNHTQTRLDIDDSIPPGEAKNNWIKTCRIRMTQGMWMVKGQKQAWIAAWEMGRSDLVIWCAGLQAVQGCAAFRRGHAVQDLGAAVGQHAGDGLEVLSPQSPHALHLQNGPRSGCHCWEYVQTSHQNDWVNAQSLMH